MAIVKNQCVAGVLIELEDEDEYIALGSFFRQPICRLVKKDKIFIHLKSAA